MITLKGTAKHPGIAIATAAVIDFAEGPSSLPYSILQRAMEAVKRQLIPADQPEVVMVSEQLFFGATLRIPGLQKAALIAESAEDAPDIPIDVPCVVGVPDAMKAITSEAIVIVDGFSGDVVVDPDAQAVVEYQTKMEEGKRKARVFLESEHLPARTLGGRQISVAARVRSLQDLQDSVVHGADAITAELKLTDPDCEDIISSVMAIAGGKPVTFMPDELVAPLLQCILRLSLPAQTTFAFPADQLESQKARLLELLDIIDEYKPYDDLCKPEFAVIARSAADTYVAKSTGAAVILERPEEELEGAVRKWVSESRPEKLTVVLGTSVDALPSAVDAGAEAVEVAPGLVEKAKDMIRQIPSPEDQ